VGSAASVYAIAITLWQLRQVKRVAQAAKDAALQKSEEIESFLTYADIEKHLEMCYSIFSYVNVYIRCLMSSPTLCQVLQQIIKNVIVNQKDARKTLHNDFT
jgi:hypothetical protein